MLWESRDHSVSIRSKPEPVLIHLTSFPLYPGDAFASAFPRSRALLMAHAENAPSDASEMHVVVDLPPVEQHDESTEVLRIELVRGLDGWRLQYVPCPEASDGLTAGIEPLAADINAYLNEVLTGLAVSPFAIESSESLRAAELGPFAVLDTRRDCRYPIVPLEMHCMHLRNTLSIRPNSD